MLKKDKNQHIFKSRAEFSPPEIFQNRIVCEWFTMGEAAYYLGITQNALRMMVHRRQVKFSKLGRRVRFHIADLKALLIPDRG